MSEWIRGREGLFGSEKCQLMASNEQVCTSREREREARESINISLSLTQSFHPQHSFISRGEGMSWRFGETTDLSRLDKLDA